MKKKLISCIFLLLSALPGMAAEHEYNLLGSFTLPDKSTVKYELEWVEEDGQLAAEYEDNRKVKSALGMGRKTSEGREILIHLPEDHYGVKTLLFKTIGVKGAQTTSVPVHISLLDGKGKILARRKVRAHFIGEP